MEVTSNLRLWFHPESESYYWSEEWDGLSHDVTHDSRCRREASEQNIEEPEPYRHQHIAITPEDCACHKPSCPICEWGLVVCSSCGGSEASLTLDCCRRPLRPDEEDKIAEGKLDYFSGAWING